MNLLDHTWPRMDTFPKSVEVCSPGVDLLTWFCEHGTSDPLDHVHCQGRDVPNGSRISKHYKNVR